MKKIRFLKATSYYLNYLNNKRLITTSSLDNYCDNIFKDYFDWGDGWKYYLEKTGRFDVSEIIINHEESQKDWAKRNNASFSEKTWVLDILESQIKQFKPEILFAHDYKYINDTWIEFIKNKYSFLKVVIGYDGTALNNGKKFSNYDIMLSCLKSTTEYYNSVGIYSYYLPFAFDTRLLDVVSLKKRRTHSFTFIGSVFSGYHLARKDLIMFLVKNTPLRIWTNNYNNQWKLFSKYQLAKLMKIDLNSFYDNLLVSLRRNDQIFGVEMYKLLSDSLITFNTHGDNELNEAANRRLFESTGVGACLLTDWRDNIADFFEPEKEIITFRSKDECVSKVKFYLKNIDKLNKISHAGHLRTLSDHTLESRIYLFHKALLRRL